MFLKRSAILKRLENWRPAIASIFAMSLKAAGALITIGIFTLAARAMSADEFGQLAIWFNAMSLLAVAAVFGQDTLISRSWGEHSGRGEHHVAKDAYRFGWQMTLLSGCVFVVGLFAVVPFLDIKIGQTALYACAFFLFMQTMLHFSSHSSRMVAGFIVSEVNRELVWRFVLLFVILWAILHQGLTLGQFFFAAAGGMILSVVFQSIAVRRKFATMEKTERSADIPTSPINRSLLSSLFLPRDLSRQWFSRASAMWLSAVVEAVSQYADVMLIGYFASPAVAGDYFVAARIANVFPMVTTGLHTYSMTHSAHLFFSGQIHRLQFILRSLALVSLAFLLPPVVLILIAGEPILSIFGPRYVAVYPTLIVLTLASFARSLCGPAPGILLTTGHERLYSWIVILATLARMATTAILAKDYGALGAAWGWTIGNLPLALALVVICRAVCSVDTSVLAILSSSKQVQASHEV